MACAAMLLFGAALGEGARAQAQGVDCDKLYAAVQSADETSRNGGQWGRAAAQQRREIDRTQRYADQLGCGGGGFFGSTLPECDAVNDRLRRMQDNLDTIEAQGSRDADSGNRRAALVARYNASCVGVGGGNPADQSQQNGRGFFPDGVQDPAVMPDDQNGVSDVPPGGDIMTEPGGEAGGSAGKAICVRTCDGGWFPLAAHASTDQLGSLQQLCQASCPGTEAKLYTMRGDDNLSSAVSADGAAYTALPAAFKFEKSFSPTCSCKPPNQSWAQALAGAEQLLDVDRHDVTVTAALSDEMAKPGAVPVTKDKAAKSGKASKAVKSQVPSAVGNDTGVARDSQLGQQAPTASNATTGIGGPIHAARVVPEGAGPTVAVTAPDGTKKRVRLIVP